MARIHIGTGGPNVTNPREPADWHVLRRLAGYLPPLKWKLLGAALCTIAVSLSGLGVGWIIKQFMDAIKLAETEHQLRGLNLFTVAAISLFVLKGLFNYGQQVYMASATHRLAMQLRNQIFAHLQRQSLSFYDARKTGQLMSAITSDVPVIQHAFTVATLDVFGAPVTIIGGVAVLFWINWRLALLSLICLPATAWLINQATRRMRRYAARLQSSLAEVSEVAEESLAGHRAVKAFGNEELEIRRFDDRSRSVFKSIMGSVRVRALLGPSLEMIGSIAILLVLWFGGREIARGGGALTFPNLMWFVYTLKEIGDAARNGGSIYLLLASVSAGARRIFELLDIEPDIIDRPGAQSLPAARGRVAFDRVGFEYHLDTPVLLDVSFTVEPGQVAALVGPSGGGKSTIVSLIPRFYDVNSGVVRIDGTDVRDVTLASLRAQIGIVPQDPHLFAGSIYENILYGRIDACREEVIAAAKAANAHGFIEGLPQGYDTLVGERGVRLSGGQRQRISIARAILRDPRILILDEATSALDTESEALVQEALQRLVADRTTLVIAHRLSTIQHADVILVVDQGRIVERGSHAELLAHDGVYARLYHTQFRLSAAREAAPSLAG